MVERLFILALFTSLWADAARGQSATDESFFTERVYPVLQTAQCVRCHSDNGVASETELAFPSSEASPEQITAFGLSLLDLVDRKHPDQSLLLLKPTKRIKHTGGQRIKPGSDEEKVLLTWVNYLAGLSDLEIKLAREKVAKAQKRGLKALATRRLTHSQYDHTVRDLLGDQLQPASSFPKEDFINGFRNQAEGQGVSPLLAEAYSKAAERLAAAAFRGGDQRSLLPTQPKSPTDAAAADKFVRQFGLKAFRRPLSDDESRLYASLLLEESARTQDFLSGATLIVEAMLQSPHFLFRIERGGDNAQPAGRNTAAYEAATRLSYFLWDTMPTGELLSMAEKGELQTVEQVERVARRMLDDPRAKESLEEFLAQWMRFDRVLSATRDRRRFRDFNADIAGAMVQETQHLFNHLVWGDRNFMEFFTADYTFVNADLARLYGLPAPDTEFGRVDYPPESGRSGVLGHGSFLVLTSKPAETSPTARGLFIRNHFLGQEIPPPPAGVNAVLPTVTEDKPLTNRQRLDIHLNSESCAGCHRLIDPIGLGFEQYNAIGAFQPKMSLQFGSRADFQAGRRPPMVELDLDTTGFIQGVENSEFRTPKELGRLLAESSACQRCIVKQLFRYALGREETAADQPVIDALVAKFHDSGYRFKELVVALVTSDLFLQRDKT